MAVDRRCIGVLYCGDKQKPQTPDLAIGPALGLLAGRNSEDRNRRMTDNTRPDTGVARPIITDESLIERPYTPPISGYRLAPAVRPRTPWPWLWLIVPLAMLTLGVWVLVLMAWARG